MRTDTESGACPPNPGSVIMGTRKLPESSAPGQDWAYSTCRHSAHPIGGGSRLQGGIDGRATHATVVPAKAGIQEILPEKREPATERSGFRLSPERRFYAAIALKGELPVSRMGVKSSCLLSSLILKRWFDRLTMSGWGMVRQAHHERILLLVLTWRCPYLDCSNLTGKEIVDYGPRHLGHLV